LWDPLSELACSVTCYFINAAANEIAANEIAANEIAANEIAANETARSDLDLYLAFSQSIQ
jgi:hypothetical protein